MRATIVGEKTGKDIWVSVIDYGYGDKDHPFEIAAGYCGKPGLFEIFDGDTVMGYLNADEVKQQIKRISGEFWIPTLTGKKTKEITGG